MAFNLDLEAWALFGDLGEFAQRLRALARQIGLGAIKLENPAPVASRIMS